MADSSVFHNLKIHIVQFLIIVCFASPSSANSNSADSSKIEEKASVKTVYFNAWGGDPKINSFIEWAGNRVREEYKISLVHVKLSNTASAVSRILSEKVAGREKNGTVDLLWVNGENFSAMKSADLLLDHSWANTLPNWRYTDSDAMPGILFDFAELSENSAHPL